jgi:hypothetical protein
MSHATVEAVVLEHLELSFPDLTDVQLGELDAEYAALPGPHAAEVRHRIDREKQFRQKVRRTNLPRRQRTAA